MKYSDYIADVFTRQMFNGAQIAVFPHADFNVRLLGPCIGLHDDPPVGSAMLAFCSDLCSFEHTQKGTHVFSVDRGDDKNRRSVISLEMDNKREESLTIRMGGHAVLVAEGTLQVAVKA